MKSLQILTISFAGTLAAMSAPAEIDFSRDVRPILNKNCLGCHGGVKKQSDVSFLYRDQVLAKGKSGKPTVVPGDPDASEMMVRIQSNDPDEVMPQPDHGPPLKKEEIELIRQWIEEGAHWNNHWSFELPQRHDPPKVKKSDWIKRPMDAFILSKLESKGLAPSSPAQAARLLRRLHMDTIGLPPSLEQLDAFSEAFANDPDKAVSDAVDQLLSHQGFGEKWASSWLDVARYADSEGLGADRRWNAWPYRDWVIRSLNSDLPYDQFLTKQIAGDLLKDPNFDDLIATKFHRLTQQNQEGGTDNEEFRTMAVMDRVNTTWTGLQGITFECVQCHDHPYDPIRHDEYYKFLAFFNNSRDLDLATHYPVIKVPAERGDFAKAAEARKNYRKLQSKFQDQAREQIAGANWQKVNQMKVVSERVGSTSKEVDGFLEFRTEGTIPNNIVFKLAIPRPEGLTKLNAFRIHTLPLDLEKARHSGSPGAVLSQIKLNLTIPDQEKPIEVPLRRVIGDDDFPHWNPNDSLKKSGSGWGAYTHQFHPRSCVVILEETLALPEGATLNFTLSHTAASPTAPMATKRGRIELTADNNLHEWLEAPETKNLLQERDHSRNEYHKLGKTNLATMSPLQNHLKRETKVFERGNWLEKVGDTLSPGTPGSLHPLQKDGEQEANRLDLARWLTSQENPFTSRVAVARVWEQIFGLSLVETLEDFGSSGVSPSHPKLLDDLAVRFQTEMKYSLKELIREILNSATYRQSSKHTSTSIEKDPENRLLSRGPRNRLSAELVRDHHLTASGLLNPELYGPPVRPPIPGGVWKPFSDGPWNAAEVGDPNRYRRALYTYWKRSIPYPGFDAFDSPTRETCSARRLISNTPLAALATLNDEAYAEMAGGLARQMKYGTEGDVETRLRTGYRLATSVAPSERQLEILIKLFEKTVADYEKDSSQYAGLAGTADGAAYTVVAGTLLNMDDALTK